MPKRPTDEQGAEAKRARTETPASTSPPSAVFAPGLQLLLDAYMKEKTGCTVSLNALVDLFGGASSSLPRDGASSGQGGIDSSSPSQDKHKSDGRKSGGAKASSGAASKPGAGSGAKKHQCHKCLKFFSTPSELERHDLVHTGEKPHSCRLCLREFPCQQPQEARAHPPSQVIVPRPPSTNLLHHSITSRTARLPTRREQKNLPLRSSTASVARVPPTAPLCSTRASNLASQ
ncbi:hypothetical protein T484DRAFT_3627837 [Baffinella frigidus]|nr:hypothetical protein T484DRAFT_3627837 [Cryptophyta sp. CCMP2293]